MVGMQTDVVIHYVLRFETIRLVAFAKINFRITVFGCFIRFYMLMDIYMKLARRTQTLRHKTDYTTTVFFFLEWQLNLIFSFVDYITLYYGHSRWKILVYDLGKILILCN